MGRLYITSGARQAIYDYNVVYCKLNIYASHVLSTRIWIHYFAICLSKCGDQAMYMVWVCLASWNSKIPLIQFGIYIYILWRHYWITRVHLMACCLTAPSHDLNQGWLITNETKVNTSHCFNNIVIKMMYNYTISRDQWINSLRPSDMPQRVNNGSGNGLYSLTAPSHYLNQC